MLAKNQTRCHTRLVCNTENNE